MTGSLCFFFSKHETTNFSVDIEDNVPFNSFVCKTKLVGETEAQTTPDNNNRILKNGTMTVPLKY